MTELEHYIQGYFGPDQQSLASLAHQFQETTLAKGEFFCESGLDCSAISFIKTGALRVFEYSDKKDVTQWVAGKGEFITDLSSLVFDTPARWNIQALTDCELYTMRKADYQNLSMTVPDWAVLEKKFIAKCFLTLEDRVFSFLSLSAEERYTEFTKHRMELFNVVPHHFLASMLGMTPETLSRMRKKTIS